jgi:exopolysaccharide biosynthesis predicted pyruvyltransferase EpsI
MKILVVGYYNHNNLGDDMYQVAFPKLLVGHQLDFIDIIKLKNKSPIGYDLIVLGGGDVMNNYFLKTFSQWHYNNKINVPCHAYSIGTPYLSLVEEGQLDIFDYIVCRNKQDTQTLQKRFGNKNVIYMPDFVFIEGTFQKKIKPTINEIFLDKKPIITIFLAKPCINNLILEKLSGFINNLSDKYHFLAYPLNTNQKNLNENDYIISMELQKKAPTLEVFKDTLELDDVLNLIKSSYFTICMRLHAHIFSIMAETPFISIYSTRKVRNLLDDFMLNNYGTPLYLDCNYCNQVNQPPRTSDISYLETFEFGCMSCRQMCGKPADVSIKDLNKLHQDITTNHKYIQNKLKKVREDISIRLATINQYIPNMSKRTGFPYYLSEYMIE